MEQEKAAAETQATPERWAVVELMDHKVRAGKVSEVQQFGVAMCRIQIPAGEGFTTEDVNGSSIYRIRWVEEELARAVATWEAKQDSDPIVPYGAQLMLRAGEREPIPGL